MGTSPFCLCFGIIVWHKGVFVVFLVRKVWDFLEFVVEKGCEGLSVCDKSLLLFPENDVYG